VTAQVHPDFKKLAIGLMEDMGLRFGGVNFMIEGDISKSLENSGCWRSTPLPGLIIVLKPVRFKLKLLKICILGFEKHGERLR